jgi:hypothetical protein
MRDIRMLLAALLLPGSVLVASAITLRVLLRSASTSGRRPRRQGS